MKTLLITLVFLSFSAPALAIENIADAVVSKPAAEISFQNQSPLHPGVTDPAMALTGDFFGLYMEDAYAGESFKALDIIYINDRNLGPPQSLDI